MERRLNSQKETKKYYHRIQKMSYIVHFSDVYNLGQKLDNSVQIVRITGHAWRRKVVQGRRVILSLAEHLQGRQGNPLARVTLALN